MSLLEKLRDANEARLLGEVLARSEGFWGLTEARLSALVPPPVSLLEGVARLLLRVRRARVAIYPRVSPEDVEAFTSGWTAEQERKLSLALLSEDQRLTEIGVAT